MGGAFSTRAVAKETKKRAPPKETAAENPSGETKFQPIPPATSEVSAKGATAQTEECRLRIFHVNDVYLLENFPALKACIDTMSKGQPNVITTLAGDFLAPSLLSSIDQGRGIVAVMNDTPVDAVCFGNHEADVPFPSLVSRINEFGGAWLNSNMRSFSEEVTELQPGKAPDHHIIKLVGGRTVALVGLNIGGGTDASLYRGDAFGGHASRITPVLTAAPAAVDRVRAACPEGLDCVVPLTHQLMPEDRKLCGMGLPFPVILGGHEHEVYDEVHSGTRILKSGSDAFNVTVVDLVWAAGTPPNSMPTKVSAELVPLGVPKGHKGEPPALRFAPGDAALRETCAHWERPAIELREAQLAQYEVGFLSSVGCRTRPSTMASAIASALKQTAKADGAVINAGGVRGAKVYEDGKVTFADLSKECPFPSENITIIVTGAAISDAVQLSRCGWPESSGMALHADERTEVDPETHAIVSIDGEPLDRSRLYSIVVDSYIVKANDALRAYATEHPEHIPPDDSGRPALPILVEYYCNRLWRQLLDSDGNGSVTTEECKALFAEADTSGDGKISEDEVLAVMMKRLDGITASAIIARQCLSAADRNRDGAIELDELIAMVAETSRSRATEMSHSKVENS